MSYLPSRHAPGRRAKRRNQAGFTIIEVTMAAAIMAIVISGAIIVMQSGFKAMDNARNTTLASQIIQSEMERIRLLNWSDVSSLGTDATIDLATIFPPGTATTALSSRFTAKRTCTDVPDKIGEMKAIAITVTWTGVDGRLHTRSTNGNYTKNGLYDYYYTLAGG